HSRPATPAPRSLHDALPILKRVGGMIAEGQAVVFALGDNASIDAVNGRVREVGGSDVETFTIDDNNEALVREAADHIPEPTGPIDRKSTRLNSSHQIISYAV